MKASLFICSFQGSKHLATTVASIIDTFPRDKYDMELLVDCEAKRTGLANTANRYMNLYGRSTGDVCAKIDDDVRFYPGWFEKCVDVITNNDNIAFCGPISHQLMVKLKVNHAMDSRIPIEPDGYRCEPVVSGMCWLFKRELWQRHPYSKVAHTWRLDGHYANLLHEAGLRTAVLNGALVAHLGQDRYKGVPTDTPGKLASGDFQKKNPQVDFSVY